jgi:hypothetical protein
LELVVFWAGECVQQPVNTPPAGELQPTAHDLPSRQIDLQTSKTTGVLGPRYR